MSSAVTYTSPEMLPKLAEWHVYGNEQQGRFLTKFPEQEPTYYGVDLTEDIRNNIFSRQLGKKAYELKDHLGNVRVTFSDIKMPTGSGSQPFMVDLLSKSEYYPYGMKISELSYSPTGARYGYNSQEQSTELNSDGNHTTAEFWEYDARSARRWNLDPVVKQHTSGYNTFASNPIWFTDMNGDDTISVNETGIITGINAAEGYHIILDHKKNQLKLNDPKYDTELINQRGVKVGDQLINYMTKEETQKNVDDKGKITSRNLSKGLFLGLAPMKALGVYNYFKSLFDIKEKSYKEWDFSHSLLAPKVNADYNHNLGNENRDGIRLYRDDYTYEQYYFFVFGNTNTVYNLGDAGNFMWGMAGNRSGFSFLELKAGAHANELRQFRSSDSEFDQKAIEAGIQMGGK